MFMSGSHSLELVLKAGTQIYIPENVIFWRNFFPKM